MAKRVVFRGERQVELEEFQIAAPTGDQVRVRSVCSLLSTGTETICFLRRFEPNTHWDNWVKYPFYPGYSMIGEVEAVGPDVRTLKVGDRVALRKGHASHHLVPAAQCVPVPAAMNPRDASWFALAKITFMGALAAEYRLGDSVLVIGAGPIGQMSIRWAQAAGVESLVAAEFTARRLTWARQGGATHVIAKPVQETLDELRAASHGELPRVVMDTTGHATVFAQALACARRKGTVVVMGDTGSPSQQHLSSDVVIKGLTIRGAHDSHDTPEWHIATIARLFFHLAATGRFNLDGLITHTFRPEQCKEVYGLASDRRDDTMGILFDWTAS